MKLDSPDSVPGGEDASGFRFAVVASRYSGEISARLAATTCAYLEERGADAVDLFWVPGAFELPGAIQPIAESGLFHAVVGLGCILKGETDHDIYLAHAVAQGCTRITLDTGVPVLFGVITARTVEQARARAGFDEGGKGREAAAAAIAMARLHRELPDRLGPVR
ncbi:MAG: 6,7-dimethyl-8-ribityllumazine synthase [Candidatus Eisenbacteria bacterium]|uniref:6,7-dimethyl-8-ribityllumazine synthase n=1 Tax=Eiseniibacteriota bacterium TaxID=2212470 RepID=A0A956LZQ6_UNCEI|nr:6,7-dimethyl-8-ribityllumazine synthase [Candidatus Eisenbacteria bacterium]